MMKNTIYLMTVCTLLMGVGACGGEEEPPKVVLVGGMDSLVKTTTPIPDLVPVEDTVVEIPVELLDSSLLEATRLESMELAKTLTAELKAIYERMEDKKERYVDAIALNAFLGTKVDIGELEISQVNPSFVRIHADYFDGEPIGGKRFFVNNGELLGVEIIQLKEKITENGTQVVEEVSHVFYYNKGVLLEIWDNKKHEAVDPTEITWLDENLADWKLIKAQL